MLRPILVYVATSVVFGCLFGCLMCAILAESTVVAVGLTMVIMFLGGKVYRGEIE